MYSMMIMLMFNFMSFFIFNFQPKRKKKKRTNTIIERLNLRLLRKKHFRVLSTTGVLHFLHWVSRTFSCHTFYVNVQASRLMMVKFTVVGFR
uniref:Uncharacterized protein n=1 Tax=Anguilla anguilla TaxID=7936 RepID=A0A0E9Y098_ANGAN